MGKKTRKEHMVPQTHIRYFSYKNRNTDKIVVVDKNKKEPYLSCVKDVACKRDLYEVSDKEANYWEKWYGKIEEKIPMIYNAIIINSKFANNKEKVLSNFLKRELSLIIISQLLRTEVSKKHFTQIGLRTVANFLETINSLLDGELSKEQIELLNAYNENEDFVYSLSLEHWNSNDFVNKCINILLNKVWIIHKNLNYKETPFVTSDNPVVLYNLYTHEIGFGNNGLLREGTIIYFSINKELLVAIYPKFEELKKYNDKIDFLNDNSFAIKLNQSHYIQCGRQVFFSIDLEK